MRHDHKPASGDEPAVTFEINEAPQRQERSGRLGAAGAAAVAGAGLVSGGAASDIPESLDVFEQDPAVGDPDGIPTTSFNNLGAQPADPAFPPIDFAPVATDDAMDSDDDDPVFGASSDSGGGFVLDSQAAETAFAAPDNDLDPVGDSLVDDQDLAQSDLDADIDSEDIDLP